MDYLSFTFNTTAEQSELLLALLADAGFEGFEEEEQTLKAFLPKDQFNQEDFDAILEKVPVSYVWEEVKPQNWNAIWEAGFEPIRVGHFAGIRAGFHAPLGGLQHEIIITPKMSFGTGHHATTYLMMEQLSALDLKNKSVVDFGTGTGVLAILAEKMGAREVLALDNDDWSIENAKENLQENQCRHIRVEKADALPADMKFDIILANINLNVILQSLPAILAASHADTLILLSGFLQTDEVQLFRALAGAGLLCNSITQKGEWICVNVKQLQ
ncbi:MAG: 50S ribosomal protein L11 methyltransferase [Ferruginibacter sp.]